MFFTKRRMLLVAGPSGSGKSTFIRLIGDNNQSIFTKEVLEKTLLRNRIKTKRLRGDKLRKIYAEQKNLIDAIKGHTNFILHIDTTGPRYKENLVLLPDLFPLFDVVSSVQVFTKIDLWHQRNMERIENNTQKPSKIVKRMLRLYSSDKKRKIKKAKSMYLKSYTSWESFLKSNGIFSQFRVDPIKKTIISSSTIDDPGFGRLA